MCHSFSLVILLQFADKQNFYNDDIFYQYAKYKKTKNFYFWVILKNNIQRNMQMFNKQIDCRDLGHVGTGRNG